ncbi:DsbA family oxidoreductase [Altererythrobacter aerius]|uniref:DsbA family oxidoreductase n=1 Tax=Tsuneonella aeria TaxID=1837929 RepID=A0A6I4T965_9SPHN|nr:DsbA family oxidoreductase [Tsuneonella aeria]MXO73643.1 DsbA family oxidoreductase [Tsuneonella aeria]
MIARVDIAIWSDVMCPWCVVGYKNLERALAMPDGEIVAEVCWLPFELNPDMPAEGEESRAHIARKYGRTPEQAEASRTMLADRARAAGFPFDYTDEGDPPPLMMWNTFGAHKLMYWALEKYGAEAQTRLQLALFAAHFQRRQNVSDHRILVEIARSVGFDPGAAKAALNVSSLGDKVRAEQQRAFEQGITAVPAVEIDSQFLVPGAQEPNTYVNVLRKVVARRT